MIDQVFDDFGFELIEAGWKLIFEYYLLLPYEA
jgi:hypothetical protein